MKNYKIEDEKLNLKIWQFKETSVSCAISNFRPFTSKLENDLEKDINCPQVDKSQLWYFLKIALYMTTADKC